MSWARRIGRQLSDSARGERALIVREGFKLAAGAAKHAATIAATNLTKPPVIQRIKPKFRARLKHNVLHKAIRIKPHVIFPATVASPAPEHVEPISVGSVVLYPRTSSATALYSARTPMGVSAAVLLRTGEVDGTIRTTGGSATVLVSGLPLLSEAEIEDRRGAWTEALAAAGHRRSNWRFHALNIRSMEVELDLPSGHTQTEPQVSVDPDMVEAVIVLDLSAHGAQVWRQALENDAARAVTGAITMTTTFAVNQEEGVSAQSRSASAPIGSVIAMTVADIRRVRSEVEVEARLVVRGHPTVARIAVDLHARGTVRSEILDGSGGEIALRLATSDPATEDIRWTARVSFAPSEWPVVATEGRLNSEAGWVDILAPATWVRSIDVLCVLEDADGNAVPAEGEGSEAQIVGGLSLDAPFIEGPSLEESFELRNQDIVTLRIPAPPGAGMARLTLRALAKRGAQQRMHTRNVGGDETWVLIKVRPDASAVFQTNRSAGAETRRNADYRDVLAHLTGSEA